MSGRKIAGIVLIGLGIVVLLWGGIFWTDRDTVIDAGPLQVTRDERKGLALPPVLGGVAVIGGIVLLAIPDRRRVS
jgi:drug/metabolite transporter (DMT)-like permease